MSCYAPSVSRETFELILTRFLEAASIAAKRRQIRRAEGKLERAMRKAFRAQGKRFVKGFVMLRAEFEEVAYYHDYMPFRLKEAITERIWAIVFDRAARETLNFFLAPLSDTASAGLRLGALGLISDLSLDLAFDLKHPLAVAYVREHGAELVTKINETTRGYIRTVIEQAVEEGWSYNVTARAISDRFEEFAVGKPQQHIESRAHLVAINEAGEAYEQGAAIVVQDLTDAGIETEKSWITVGDNRVSEGCQENERAGWIPFAQAFPSGHQRPLRFPGCRCAAAYRRAK